MSLLDFHRQLLVDRAGQQGFRKALFETLRGGETVLDLGTGTGIHALFACQAGAKRVYAVDQDEVIELAREICQANGHGDRVIFLHAPIEQVELPEQVDVIVAHHGLPGLFSLLRNARDRFLKRGGVLIPAAVELFCAPLEAPAAYDELVGFWDTAPHGLTYSPVRSYAINAMHDWQIDPGELLAEPMRLSTFDFSETQRPMLAKMVESTFVRPGILHGVGVWYVQWLTKGIALSTAPPANLPPELWANTFLPIATPTSIDAGDTARIRIRTGTGGWGMFWTWDVIIGDRCGREKARFAHSTFAGQFLSRDSLRKQSLDYVPHLTQHGKALQFALGCCDGTKSLRWIESEVFNRFPALFRNRENAAAFVSEIVTHHST